MTTKISPHGDSSAIVIDKPMLDLLKIDSETPLRVSTDGQRLIIEPVRDCDRAQKFAQAVAEADREYGTMFKKLAQ